MSHILIVEDDPRISSFIVKGLKSAGYLSTVEQECPRHHSCALPTHPQRYSALRSLQLHWRRRAPHHRRNPPRRRYPHHRIPPMDALGRRARAHQCPYLL